MNLIFKMINLTYQVVSRQFTDRIFDHFTDRPKEELIELRVRDLEIHFELFKLYTYQYRYICISFCFARDKETCNG